VRRERERGEKKGGARPLQLRAGGLSAPRFFALPPLPSPLYLRDDAPGFGAVHGDQLHQAVVLLCARGRSEKVGSAGEWRKERGTLGKHPAPAPLSLARALFPLPGRTSAVHARRQPGSSMLLGEGLTHALTVTLYLSLYLSEGGREGVRAAVFLCAGFANVNIAQQPQGFFFFFFF
jgi:hypothetical protein